jgi:hypothetical protein
MAHSGGKDTYANALKIFETVYKHGEDYAGVHIARMRFDGWGTEKNDRDIGKANSNIDKVFSDFIHGDLSLTRESLGEVLDLRIRIKLELIANGKGKPEVLLKRTKELIETLLECVYSGFKDYEVRLAMLLDPCNTTPSELRKIIDDHDELKAYCQQMYDAICAQGHGVSFGHSCEYGACILNLFPA